MTLTLDDLRQQNLILLECTSGSRAYGLATATSDTDIKGVFYLPKTHFFSLQSDYLAQISNPSNDIVYYELGRFIELLLQNNPNMMELLATPEACVRYRHPFMKRIRPEWFISKLCEKTFAGFAQSQIKKARGLNKKIVNPMEKRKKSILDFCVVFHQGKSIPVTQWLAQSRHDPARIGVAHMPHAAGMYALYLDPDNQYAFSGLLPNPTANQLSLSSIPKGLTPTTYLAFNQDGYSQYCKAYREYWAWVKNRNQARYQSTLDHGRQYDAKNMMHTIRLLQMALEIGRDGAINVARANRDELLAIKVGQYDYSALLAWADQLSGDIRNAFAASALPETPNRLAALAGLCHLREQLYAVDRFGNAQKL